MSDAVIRPAVPDDLRALATLNRAALPAVADVTDLELARLVDQSLATLVATVDGTVVAFLLAFGPGAAYESPNYRFFDQRYVDYAYVDRVVVTPSHQRHGIGSALYDALEEQVAGTATIVACEVNVRPPNPTSLAFHVARGFQAVGEQDTDGGKKRVRMFVRELD